MLVAQLWAERRLPLDEILDAPAAVLQALAGLAWHRERQAADMERHEAHRRDMAAAAAMHQVLKGVH